ncbi:unnamed protein product [Rhodiola kirilowii]
MHLCIILSAILVPCSPSLSSKENENDRMALMALRDEFIGSIIPSDGSPLNSWNASLHFCQWQGVTCGKRHRRVTVLDLVEQKLDGVLSTSIGNLTFLRELYLTKNALHGEIPKEIGKLGRLQYLRLGGNSFEGRIPPELSNCSNLLQVQFSRNKITGIVSSQFASLLKLTLFSAYKTNLMGEMPCFFRNISSLRSLHLAYNHFHGEIRDCLRGLTKLTLLSLSSNDFSGTISPLYNVSSSFEILEIANNSFTGTLAQDMDIAFPKLTYLTLAGNSFTGTIPSSLANISRLTLIQLQGNYLSGRVPDNLGKLENLRILNLDTNNLGSEKSNDLNFIDSLTNCTKLEILSFNTNRFTGSLPDSIANFTSKLNWLVMYENHIKGSIPEGIGELSGLAVADFSSNFLTGTIPKSIGKLTNLSILNLYVNKLQGEIPSSIYNLTRLYVLDLSTNSLDGIIPTALGNCTSMQQLNISRNQLSGNLPDDLFTQFQGIWSCDLSYNSFHGIFSSEFGKLLQLSFLDVSHNNISGEIPAQLGDLSGLESLIMARNFFQGSIPASLGRLRGLKRLDLSNNNLSGVIPKNLVEIRGLRFLNLAYNHLQGEVPLFHNVTQFSFVGNNELCGGIPETQLLPCLRPGRGKTISRNVVIAITLSVIAALSLFGILFIFLCRHRKYKKDDMNAINERYQRVTYAELFKATQGFTESNLIGSGNFGDVYRGIFDGNERKLIAVKVLNLSKHGATKSFKTECKVLRRIRHRNLLRIITSCSSLDHKGNDFKALVFDFMSNGSLDNWLYFIFNDGEQRETRNFLTLARRLEIAIDVGCALDYLHNCCETPIVHCDLKPSNILLDEDMVAHVGDFGLAKMFQLVTENLGGGESLSTAIKGSIGYVAPEYGMGAAISPQGDIYSYGITLLELITGKRPTDDMFNNEMSLRNFCERALPDHVQEIVDECLVYELREATATQRNPEEFKNQWYTFLTSFVEVGLSCSMDSSRDRMDIQSAIKCLKKIKEKYDMVC